MQQILIKYVIPTFFILTGILPFQACSPPGKTEKVRVDEKVTSIKSVGLVFFVSKVVKIILQFQGILLVPHP
jgi:hypothetical protein